jgi:hypothetical protein
LCEGLGGDWLRQEGRSAESVCIWGDIVLRCEDDLEVRQVRQKGVAKREAIERGKIDLGNQQIAAAVGIDPFDHGIGIGSDAGGRFPEGNEGL